MKKDRVCLTTFIYGEVYQNYIPFLVYSCHKSYPEYDILLFVYGRLTEGVRRSLDYLAVRNCRIVENAFADCPKMTPLKAQSLRWVLWDDTFANYDYLYIVDVDMLYIREPRPLHEQHIEHMQTTSLCYDNIRRVIVRKPWKPYTFGKRLKEAGLRAMCQFIFGNKQEYRATGLHFIDVKEYYSHLTKTILERYKRDIYNKSILTYVMTPNDEVMLYKILEREALTPNRLAIQEDSVKMLDFNNCTRPQFRPHHGIHLGMFRHSLEEISENPGFLNILNSAAYKYYIDVYQREIMSDVVFMTLIDTLPEYIKVYFQRLNEFYKQ